MREWEWHDGGVACWGSGMMRLTVGDIDPSWYSTGGKGDNVQRCKVRSEEGVLFKCWWPWEGREKTFSCTHQVPKLSTHGLINNSNKP